MIGDLETLSKLNIIRMGDKIADDIVQTVKEKLLFAYDGIIKNIKIQTHDFPDVEDINAYLITMILGKEYAGHNLGITNADLTIEDEDDFYNSILGGKNPKNDTAVASTKRPSQEDTDRDTLLERIAKISVHEVGHNLGLTDHMFRTASSKNLCPMSKGDEFNKFGFHGYLKAIIDQRGFKFCDDCENFLTKVYGY